ncbi:MAG: ABC transporter substrate-binding protein [Nostoc sp.]|uniref:ABC transporter substrate-binding protein n=1 Tax=Nostoc sp. TaxID=1180 RepID=UPI002FF4EE47
MSNSESNNQKILFIFLFVSIPLFIGLAIWLAWWSVKNPKGVVVPQPTPSQTSSGVSIATSSPSSSGVTSPVPTSSSDPQPVSTPTPFKTEDVQGRISFGEKSLIPQEAVSETKQAGINAIATKKWTEAIDKLEELLKNKPNDPETRIFLNNAKIGDAKSYTIAVTVPLKNNLNGSLEILRGVAQAQHQINSSQGNQRVPLKVAIASDDDDPEVAKQIATALVNNPDVLGVVGHYASGVTLEAGQIYTAGQLVAISPISTSVELSNFKPYIFRTVASDSVAAKKLADYMIKNIQQQKAAVFFNSKSKYSLSLKSEFIKAIKPTGQVVNEFDLSDLNFSAADSVKTAMNNDAKVLMLAANTGTLDQALQVVTVNKKRLKLLGGDDVYAPKTLEIGGDDAVDMVVAVPWHIDNIRTAPFVSESRKLWGNVDVNWRTALAYDATQALIAAINLDPSRNGVQQALFSENLAIGAFDKVRFFKSGDRRDADVQLVKVVGDRTTGYKFEKMP